MIALKFPATSREQKVHVLYIFEPVSRVLHRFHVITEPHSDTFSKSAISVLKIKNFSTKNSRSIGKKTLISLQSG